MRASDDMSKATGMTVSEKDALNLFQFGAENTQVEWRADKLKDGRIFVGTVHEEALSPNSRQMGGFSDDDRLSYIHSHPRNNIISTRDEMSSMGNFMDGSNAMGDWANMIRATRENGGKEPHSSKVYIKNTRNLYNVTYYGPKHIRKITGPNQIKF